MIALRSVPQKAKACRLITTVAHSPVITGRLVNSSRHAGFASKPPRFTRPPAELEGDPEPIELSNEIRMRNGALGLALVGFCAGIFFYSINAVGQAGGTDDPLEALKQEAGAAQEKMNRQAETTDTASDMMAKFAKGEYDPDLQEVKELEEAEATKNKKAWWKFWERS